MGEEQVLPCQRLRQALYRFPYLFIYLFIMCYLSHLLFCLPVFFFLDSANLFRVKYYFDSGV